jgi:hypothetical protein
LGTFIKEKIGDMVPFKNKKVKKEIIRLVDILLGVIEYRNNTLL